MDNNIPTLSQIYSTPDTRGYLYPAYHIDEEFRVIPQNPRYLVSNYGNIYDRNNSRLISQKAAPNGYMMARLDGKAKMVHRLVLQAFNPIPDYQEKVCNHLDTVRWNNHWDKDPAKNNLEWCTQKENVQYSMKLGHYKLAEDHANSKFTNEQVEKYCSLLNQGMSKEQVAEICGVPYTRQFAKNLCDIQRGETYRSISQNYPNINKYTGTNKKQLTDEQVHAVCRLITQGLSSRQIAAELGITYTGSFQTVVSNYKLGLCRKDITSQYGFPRKD